MPQQVILIGEKKMNDEASEKQPEQEPQTTEGKKDVPAKSKAKTGATTPAKSKPKPTPKAKPKAKDRSTDYENIRNAVERPTAERDKHETRRGNMRIPRRYHLTDKKMKRIVEEAQKTGEFPNPYRKGGIYHAIVQALANLVTDTKHSFADVKTEIQNVLGQFETKKKENAWEAFAKREARNALSGKDVDGRILQNAQVLQRLSGFHPYGEKLRQLCACVDIFKDAEGLPLLCLNTAAKSPEDVKPINELRGSSRRSSRPRKSKAKTAGETKDEVTPSENTDESSAPPEDNDDDSGEPPAVPVKN